MRQGGGHGTKRGEHRGQPDGRRMRRRWSSESSSSAERRESLRPRLSHPWDTKTQIVANIRLGGKWRNKRSPQASATEPEIDALLFGATNSACAADRSAQHHVWNRRRDNLIQLGRHDGGPPGCACTRNAATSVARWGSGRPTEQSSKPAAGTDDAQQINRRIGHPHQAHRLACFLRRLPHPGVRLQAIDQLLLFLDNKRRAPGSGKFRGIDGGRANAPTSVSARGQPASHASDR